MRALQYRSTTRNAMLTSLAKVESDGAAAWAEAEGPEYEGDDHEGGDEVRGVGVGAAGMVGAQNGGGSAACAAFEGTSHTVRTSDASNGRRFMAEGYPGSGPAREPLPIRNSRR
ncbi:hypothetical protein GCM10010532_003980 [Dactylosporangium siamense]|uniref:Uncharacterized protein n=1 Tax=Dactylosporangium siamense TaxID=685454 RepID=A0A919PVR7_9ACTN|nr:hypothetical protein Dsi01nite_073210 [Dactylosporangium siamense]